MPKIRAITMAIFQDLALRPSARLPILNFDNIQQPHIAGPEIVRPSLGNLSRTLFSTIGPFAGQTIEINGNEQCGANRMLLEFVSRATLPVQYGGCGANVILLVTDFDTVSTHLDLQLQKHIMSFEVDCMQTRIYRLKRLTYAESRQIIRESLGRCHLIRCASSNELDDAISSLHELTRNNANTALIALDSVSRFYRQDCRIEPITKNHYLSIIVSKIAFHCINNNVVFVYGRPKEFCEPPIQRLSDWIIPYPADVFIKLTPCLRPDHYYHDYDEEDVIIGIEPRIDRVQCLIKNGPNGNACEFNYWVNSYGIQWEQLVGRP